MHMTTISFDLGNGAALSLPANIVAARLIEALSNQPQRQIQAAKPKIGEYMDGQGGIYIGDILGDDGVLYGLIVSQEDAGTATWGNASGDLSAWDGLSNTSSLRDKSPAAKIASDYKRDGHCDFYLPSRREMMIAQANTPQLFNKEGWYWTSSPSGESYAWAVVFASGVVHHLRLNSEFWVRPFRRFTH